ncbi:TPA: ribbon-helix-helix protein, CopG family [Pseudomonas aeruginosa]|nr:ribbon-helix-helix protein, CopG family [Pseudomonas aeruginosa]
MGIPSKPTRAPQSSTEFIGGAPDGAHEQAPAAAKKGVRKGRRQQITHTIADDLLQRLDEAAEATGQSRAALINLAIYRLLDAGV